MFEKAETLIPGARWRDPAAVATWARDVPATRRSWSIASMATRSGGRRRCVCAPQGVEGAFPARWNRRLASGRPAGRPRKGPRREAARRQMMRLALCVALWCLSASAMAEAISFDADVVGQPPAGWTCGATGRGTPSGPSRPTPSAPGGRSCSQSGSATFPVVRQKQCGADRWLGRGEVQAPLRQGRPGRRRRLALEGRRQLLRRPRQRAREQRLALLHRARHPQDPQVRRCAGAGRPMAHAAGRVRRHQDRRLARRQALHRLQRRATSPAPAASASGPRPTA